MIKIQYRSITSPVMILEAMSLLEWHKRKIRVTFSITQRSYLFASMVEFKCRRSQGGLLSNKLCAVPLPAEVEFYFIQFNPSFTNSIAQSPFQSQPNHSNQSKWQNMGAFGGHISVQHPLVMCNHLIVNVICLNLKINK